MNEPAVGTAASEAADVVNDREGGRSRGYDSACACATRDGRVVQSLAAANDAALQRRTRK